MPAPIGSIVPTSMGEAPELTELLCFDIYAASRAITGVYRTVLAPWGLTYPQYLVLVVLGREKSCTIKFWAKLCSWTTAP